MIDGGAVGELEHPAAGLLIAELARPFGEDRALTICHDRASRHLEAAVMIHAPWLPPPRSSPSAADPACPGTLGRRFNVLASRLTQRRSGGGSRGPAAGAAGTACRSS